MFRFLIIFLSLLTFACNSSILQLQKSAPQGNLFHKQLAKDYLNFSEEEAFAYDWFDSSHFARKGKKIAKGNYVAPEDLKDWNLDQDSFTILHQARGYLTEVLTNDNIRKYPLDSAKLQFFFDCWVEQQEESWQDSHIAYCREKFYSKLDELYNQISYDEETMRLAKAKMEEQERLAQEEKAKQEQLLLAKQQAELDAMLEAENKPKLNPVTQEEPTIFTHNIMRTAYFKYNDYTLNSAAKKTIENLSKKLDDSDSYKITINGYADRSGREDYNMKLSRKRALEAKKLFTDLGINAEKIDIFAFGEINNIVETKDGVAEPANRIIEIILEY